MRYQFLSHAFQDKIPVYGAEAHLEIHAVRSLAAQDSTNVYRMTLENHWGTHVDAPNHFFIDGAKVNDYPAEFWFFRKPQVIPVTLTENQILEDDGIVAQIKKPSDLVIFYSGWTKFRDQQKYSVRNPGISPDLALAIRKQRPNLRMIGMDWISVSAFTQRELGRQTHRAFLNSRGSNHPVLLLEDMKLDRNPGKLKQVMVFPMRIEGVDSAPCTVIGVGE